MFCRRQGLRETSIEKPGTAERTVLDCKKFATFIQNNSLSPPEQRHDNLVMLYSVGYSKSKWKNLNQVHYGNGQTFNKFRNIFTQSCKFFS